ncbi:hypothetical protein [Variovorax ginsengisoli]|uniref:Uncharacterized protein n=1 Tax=Variovorax ginsengisoli TaxID=363844 RepID=A0ABT8SEI5_9BURK|nr:hypothetical protein [Variovorax ginsengisoli]MDN8617237.1 hypothetical protein [Variovorax ginsengisoli]MDO1536407.1 hypothetical protein [Variovorax ginsengisoli]
MTVQAIELSIAECDELLKSLSGPNPSLNEWRKVVQKAFAKGVAAVSNEKTIPAVLVEPLIDIAESVARAELAPPGDSRDRYDLYAKWAGEFQQDFSRRLADGKEPAFSYVEDIEAFALKKASETGFISIARPVPISDRNVFREYARAGQREGALEVDENAQVNVSQDDPDLPPQGAYVQSWQYINNDEIVGFLNAMMRDAQLVDGALDGAVHAAAEFAAPTQSREEDLDLIAMTAFDVNDEGVDTQVQYLVARRGPQAAFEAVEAAIAEAPRQADAPRG